MNKPDGGPAFPRPAVAITAKSGDVSIVEGQDGMSLRDYLAAKAMQGVASTGVIGRIITGDVPREPESVYADLATQAYGIADAMIAARKK